MYSTSLVFGLATVVSVVVAQEQSSECYSTGDLAGAVFITVVVLLALLAAAYFVWRLYWRNKRGKHLVLVTDPEKGGEYAFDNPGFKEGTPITRTVTNAKDETKAKWQNWGQIAALAAEGKPRSLDDSFIGQPLRNMVPLRSHDFTGLGFNICGNMRDGIFVKDVLHRGPASESGRIVPGDRIESVRISFRHMVFEDALTILSYASPYEVQLEVENGSSSRPATLLRDKRASASPADRICHPFYRSHSISDLSKINKSTPTKWANESHNADQSTGDSSKPAIIEVTPIEKMQKVGVRVLPHPTSNSLKIEAEKSQNARNSIIESGQVKSSNSPLNSLPKQDKSPINTMNKKTTPSPNAKKAQVIGDFDEIDLTDISHDDKLSQGDGSRKNSPSPGLKESNVKSLLVKGLNNLKEKLHVGHKSEKDSDDELKQKQTEIVQSKNVSMPSKNDITASQSADNSTENVNHNSVEEAQDIPEEVQNAGNAARSNRKSIIDEGKNWDRPISVMDVQKESERSRKDSISGGDSSSEGDATSQKKGKRKAPPPPKIMPGESSSATQTTSEVDEVDRKDNHSEKNTSLDSVDTDSEQGDKSGTTIELNSSHITVHHAPDSESNRKAASLGDLSRIGNDQPVVVLERAVSLDLADGTPGAGKKRKAPLPPQEEFTDDAGLTFSKEARIDNTVQTRLKHSSDFGRLEDAVRLNDNPSDDDTDPGVSELSTPEPDLQMLITSTPMKQNFFIPPLVNGTDSTINSSIVESKSHQQAPTPPLSPATSGVHVSSCSWDLSVPDTTTEQFVTAVNGNATEDEDDVPPELPTSPIPTYVTEIQVVTANKESSGVVENGQTDVIGGNDIFPQNLSEMSSFMTNNTHKPLSSFGNNHFSNVSNNNFFNVSPRRSEVSVINPADDLSSLPTLTNLSDSMITEVNQVSLSQPNSLDPIVQGESTTIIKDYRPSGAFVFSNENMSDEQILAMKSSPEPVVIDTSHNRVQSGHNRPAKSNVSVTSIRAGGSRIPVRAVPEPSQRKNSKKENYISFSSLNVSTPNDKKHTNGSGENSVTHIVLNSQK